MWYVVNMSLAEHFTAPPTQLHYPSDLDDLEWATLEPLLPELPPSVRPRVHRRWLLNAVFYVIKTGCQWTMLPNDYPNPKTVFHYFALWSKSGLWDSLVRALHPQERVAQGHSAQPCAVVLNSRSTKVVAKKRPGPRGGMAPRAIPPLGPGRLV